MEVSWRTATLARTWGGVVLISFSAIIVRLADVEAARSAFLRNLYAVPVLFALLWVERQRAGGSDPDRGRGEADVGAGAPRAGRAWLLPVAVVAGLFLGMDLAAWHVSIAHIGAGLATVLPNLQVVFVGVLALVVFGERPAGSFWAALPVVLLGIWLITAAGRPITADGSVVAGVALGVLTAVFYSGYLLVLRVARVRHPAASSVLVMSSATVGAALTTGAVAAVEGVAAPAGSWPADGWLVLLALGSQVVGWLLLASSIHLLPAALTSVALVLQPMLALVWGAVLLGEPIGLAQVGGAVVLLAGVGVAHRAVVAGQQQREEVPIGEPLR